jgi:GntR family transcriptional regulator
MRMQGQRRQAIERREGIPLYVTLQERIRELVEREGLQPGDMLPSEAELQARFGVSRATVRQALSTLERRGLVERQQGRGTFVTIPTMERSLPELTGFSEHVRSASMRPSSDLIEYAVVAAGAEGDSRHFSEGTELAKVVRLRYANEVPVGLHTVYLPLELAGRIGFKEERLRRDRSLSLYALFERADVQLAWAEEHLQARAASAWEASVLGTSRGAPVMSVLRLTRDALDCLLEVVRAAYLGDKYDYIVHLDRRSAGAMGGGLISPDGREVKEEKTP